MTDEHIWTIILAAGGSTRFGGVKALAAWRGGTLLSRAIDAATTCCGDRVIVVTGGHADVIEEALGATQSVHNAGWKSGLGTSIAVGTMAVLERDPLTSVVLILPVDQPFAEAGHLQALTDAALGNGRAILSGDGDIIGPPAAVPAAHFAGLLRLSGDRGLKAVLPGDVLILQSSGILLDIDTSQDLQSAADIPLTPALAGERETATRKT